MNPHRGLLTVAALAGCVLLLVGLETAGQPPYGRGKFGQGKSAEFRRDQEVFHFLLTHRGDVTREVKDLPDGVETVTESQDPAVAAQIRAHVAAMSARVEGGRGIHLRDPLFAEVFRHADKIRMEVEKTGSGVRVRETSADPHVAKVIQAHARVVSGFLKNGPAELMKNHAVPE